VNNNKLKDDSKNILIIPMEPQLEKALKVTIDENIDI